MKKTKKFSALVLVSAAMAAAGVMLGSCNGGTKTETPSTNEPGTTTEQESSQSYSTTFDNIETWDYSFVNINAFGDEAGVGMINLNSWGNKKLKLGTNGTCDGEGCKWTCTLEAKDSAYTLTLSAHLVGAGDVYSGEGDFAYIFQGSYTGASPAYVLAAPTYVKVDLTGTFKCIGDKTEFANYIPDAPWHLDSKGDGDAAATKKVVADKLVSTVFGGATFNVSGTSISSVTDINYPVV